MPTLPTSSRGIPRLWTRHGILSRSRGAFHHPHAPTSRPEADRSAPPRPRSRYSLNRSLTTSGAPRGEAAAPRHRREYVPARISLFRFLFDQKRARAVAGRAQIREMTQRIPSPRRAPRAGRALRGGCARARVGFAMLCRQTQDSPDSRNAGPSGPDARFTKFCKPRKSLCRRSRRRGRTLTPPAARATRRSSTTNTCRTRRRSWTCRWSSCGGQETDGLGGCVAGPRSATRGGRAGAPMTAFVSASGAGANA